jgi:hypothetical protein
VPRGNQSLVTQWWRNAENVVPGQGCDPVAAVPPGQQCDEYPFYSTNEAGPGARLQYVPAEDNGAESAGLRWMPYHCAFESGSAPGPLGTAYLVVPLPEIVPVTTYICGDPTAR